MIKARIEKNKVGPPFREAEFSFYYDKGISRSKELVDIASSQAIITKRGAFYSYNDERIGQGRDAAAEYLEGHKEIAKEIDSQVRTIMSKIPVAVSVDDEVMDEDEE